MKATTRAAESRARLRYLALGLGALLAHLPALRCGFVLDDAILLSKNPFVRSLPGLFELLRHELFVASAEPRLVPYYRPLSGLLNWLSYRLVADSAPLQHGLNLLLHVGVVLLVFRLVRAWGVREPIAFSLVLLFAVHPATVEVVAYIGGRQDMLGWLIALPALAAAGRVSSWRAALLLAYAASFFGALCHELFIGWFVPLALLWAGSGAGARAKSLAAAGGGALALASLLSLRHWLGLLPFDAHLEGPVRAARATVGVALRLFEDALLPSDLAVDVSVPLPGTPLALVLLGAGLAGGALLARGLGKRRRELLGPLLAGLSVIALSTALHAGVVLKYGIVSDRYAYALLVGMTLSLAVVAEAWLPAAEESRSRLTSLAAKWGAPALGLALLPLTWSRGASWVDQKSLQTAMIEDRPDDPESWLADGMLAFAEGDLERAYPRCSAYAKARPDSDKANLCVGSWLLIHGRPNQAVTLLRPYALSRPGLSSARRTFLYALLRSRDYDELERTLRDWQQAFPGAPELVEAAAALGAARGAAPRPAPLAP